MKNTQRNNRHRSQTHVCSKDNRPWR